MVDALLGEWKLTSSENFEELMKQLGVGLMTRKLGATFKPNVKFVKNGDEWVFTTTSTLKTLEVKYKIGEEFEEETLDGRKVKTVFSVDGNKLVQTQRDKENNNVVCVITREITPGGELKTVSLPSNIIFCPDFKLNDVFRSLWLAMSSRLEFITENKL